MTLKMVLRLDELVTEELFEGPKEPSLLGELNRKMWLTVRSQNSHHSLPHMAAAVFKGPHPKIHFLDSDKTWRQYPDVSS